MVGEAHLSSRAYKVRYYCINFLIGFSGCTRSSNLNFAILRSVYVGDGL